MNQCDLCSGTNGGHYAYCNKYGGDPKAFVATPAVVGSLIAQGWTPPPVPKVHRVRVVIDGGGHPRIVLSGKPMNDLASAVVELTEGVFDEEWQ